MVTYQLILPFQLASQNAKLSNMGADLVNAKEQVMAVSLKVLILERLWLSKILTPLNYLTNQTRHIQRNEPIGTSKKK